jgi:phosphoglycerate-specific signal transduction histidine kinase
VDVNQMVRAVVKFTEHEARHHARSCACISAPELPKVAADAIMIEQVIVQSRAQCDGGHGRDAHSCAARS